MKNLYPFLVFLLPSLGFAQNTFPSTGNVGIGTLAPGGKLDINAAGVQLRLSGGTVAGGVWTSATEHLYIADWNTGKKGLLINLRSGNIGIGTTEPSGKLDINQTGSQLRLSGGTLAGGLWTSATEHLYLADWDTGTKGLLINMRTGNVGIGTTQPNSYKLAVAGTIGAWGEVRVFTTGRGFPDYVFDPSYKLPTLEETEKYVKENHHLPEVPTAAGKSLLTFQHQTSVLVI